MCGCFWNKLFRKKNYFPILLFRECNQVLTINNVNVTDSTRTISHVSSNVSKKTGIRYIVLCSS